uniref:Uncharacterized protein n=1 Tax=Cacopsylla melanoneura TaxID=428564 RepID=A0A8D9F1L4_9HEMI
MKYQLKTFASGGGGSRGSAGVTQGEGISQGPLVQVKEEESNGFVKQERDDVLNGDEYDSDIHSECSERKKGWTKFLGGRRKKSELSIKRYTPIGTDNGSKNRKHR